MAAHYECNVAELVSLKSLNVSKIKRVTTAGVSKLWTLPDGQLDAIDLSHTSVEEDEACNIFSALQVHKCLRYLNLSGTKVIAPPPHCV